MKKSITSIIIILLLLSCSKEEISIIPEIYEGKTLSYNLIISQQIITADKLTIETDVQAKLKIGKEETNGFPLFQDIKIEKCLITDKLDKKELSSEELKVLNNSISKESIIMTKNGQIISATAINSNYFTTENINLKNSLEQLWDFTYLPNKKISKGDKWSNKVDSKISMDISWKLKEINENTILLTSNGTLKIPKNMIIQNSKGKNVFIEGIISNRLELNPIDKWMNYMESEQRITTNSSDDNLLLIIKITAKRIN